MASKVQEFVESGDNIQNFKFDTSLGYLRELVPPMLVEACDYLNNINQIVVKSWGKAKAMNIHLLSAWNRTIQDKAIDMYAQKKLFPSQMSPSNADMPNGTEVMLDNHVQNDGDEVDNDALIAALLQDDEIFVDIGDFD